MISNHAYDFRPKLHAKKFNYHFITSRENEVRERIPHTCPSSYDNFFQSILGSLFILRMAPHWSVKKLTSCSHWNNKQK